MLRPPVLLLLSLLVVACTSTSGRRESAWPPLEDRSANVPAPGSPSYPADPLPGVPSPLAPPTPVAPPPAPPASSAPRSPEAISGQAVLSLLRQSGAARQAGNLEQASAALERALRIEPRNYFVWSALAQVYLDQGQADQAESVAGRANSLARGNLFVELENWRTIRRARELRGDAAGSLQAQVRIEQIESQLGPPSP
ncbi:MAG TPA: tetratricopeptide repeat protein [Nevskiaceae bacterium]|nr:tetratricopeptide repeat protein [Nevskiaceae bacterium]